MSDTVQNISDATFADEVINSEKPVLVDFWAEWCGPCKMIAPIINEVAGEYANTLKIVKVDVDHNLVTPAQFGVRGIPTLILFKNGAPVAQKVGAMSKGQLQSFINQHI